MESEKSGFVNEMSEFWRKMQVKKLPPHVSITRERV